MIQNVELISEGGEKMTLQGIGEIKGKNIILSTQQDIEKILKSKNPDLASLSVEKVLPQSIRIIVRAYQPVAYYKLASSTYIIFASNGSVLRYEYEQPENMGEIRYYQPITKTDFTLGSQIRLRDVIFATQLADIYIKQGFKEFSIDIQDTHLVISELGNSIIKADSEANISRQLSSIKRIIYILQRGGEKARTVDVRFEKLIIEE
jgi:hypothetical protein